MTGFVSIIGGLPYQWGEFADFGLFGGIICLFVILPLILRLVIAYWLYKDAKKRGEEEVLWLIVGLVASFIGLIIWLVIRPDMSEVRMQRNQTFQGTGTQYSQRQYQSRPPPTSTPPKKKCPDCESQMRWIDGPREWFCDNCGEYK